MRTYKPLPNGYNSDVKIYWSLGNDNIVTYRVGYRGSTVVIAILENDTLTLKPEDITHDECRHLLGSIITSCPNIFVTAVTGFEPIIDDGRITALKLKEPLYSAYWQFIKEQFNDLSNN